MVEVWMDEYKSLFYMNRPDLQVQSGICCHHQYILSPFKMILSCSLSLRPFLVLSFYFHII